MKLFLSLVALFLVSAVTHGSPTGCDPNEMHSLDTYINSAITKILNNAKVTCINVVTRGALATCPDSYTPTSCSCGMACGSWDIRSDTTCHCQCAIIDWTSARCCKVAFT
ncbi:resistin-like [Pseudophryne corroboree]|uniref:resistin-like n=1 Tax=Pseudophryne corroboree TaxID=495146 RepID=UPI00308211CF